VVLRLHHFIFTVFRSSYSLLVGEWLSSFNRECETYKPLRDVAPTGLLKGHGPMAIAPWIRTIEMTATQESLRILKKQIIFVLLNSKLASNCQNQQLVIVGLAGISNCQLL